MTLDTSIFDWFILGMGIVAIFKGVQEYWQQHGGLGGGKKPGGPGSGAGAPDGKA